MPEDGVTVLAFDYGAARIGVAVGNSILKIAHPLETICGRDMWSKIDQIKILVLKWQPQILVIGIPPQDNNLNKIQLINTINNFSRRLKSKFNLPIVLMDEDFSSASAVQLLSEQGVYGRAQHSHLDQLAACTILNTYFASCKA